MKRFLMDNWADIAQVLLGLLALFVSYQAYLVAQDANGVARAALEGSRAQVAIIPDVVGEAQFVDEGVYLGNPSYITVRFCNSFDKVDVVGVGRTYIWFTRSTFEDSVTFVNGGGQTTSLVDATFVVDTRIVLPDENIADAYDIEIYRPTAEGDEERLAPPLEIAPGAAAVWIFKATDDGSGFADEPLGTSDFDGPLYMPEAEGTWTFRFSDGSLLVQKHRHLVYYARDEYQHSPVCNLEDLPMPPLGPPPSPTLPR